MLGTPAEQRVSILASNVFCADTPLGAVAKQTIGAAIRKYKETKPLPAIPRPLVHPDEPTPDELAIINYRNQLQRESNKVAMRQYNYELYKAALRLSWPSLYRSRQPCDLKLIGIVCTNIDGYVFEVRHVHSHASPISTLYQPARARSRYFPISRIFLLFQVDQARR